MCIKSEDSLRVALTYATFTWCAHVACASVLEQKGIFCSNTCACSVAACLCLCEKEQLLVATFFCGPRAVTGKAGQEETAKQGSSC